MKMWNKITAIPDPQEHVTKYVFDKGNAVAEAVLYRYPTYAERTVICISTQSGCPVGCRFCGAGDAFVRSLTAEEIVDQATHCLEQVFREEDIPTSRDEAPADHVHVDGRAHAELEGAHSGDPLLYLLYPNAALLISTSGPDVDYAPLVALAREVPTVGLQFSVHESTDEARNLLIPFKKKLTLDQIRQAGNLFRDITGRKPYFNYCAHDANTSFDDADRLRALFHPRDWCATVSVICERDQGSAAKNDHQRKLALDFGDKLLALGYDVRVFDPAGQDTIGGGCGQLHFVQEWFTENPEQVKRTVGTGLPQVHVPVAA
jgi:23S rRNA (adenine2503-C2)-methyltransferase